MLKPDPRLISITDIANERAHGKQLGSFNPVVTLPTGRTSTANLVEGEISSILASQNTPRTG
jgi:hypothetical protein